MIDVSDRALLLFDGDCGICSRLARTAAAIDRRRLFRIAPYFDYDEEALAPFGVTWADCTHSIQLIRRDGKVSRGAHAVNRFLWPYWPWKIGVALVVLLFPLLLLEMAGYWVVARNRHRISGWLGLNRCKVRYVEGQAVADG
jgi:predicted DCC family thiol-disulfide oxidoreductase YuxK